MSVEAGISYGTNKLLVGFERMVNKRVGVSEVTTKAVIDQMDAPTVVSDPKDKIFRFDVPMDDMAAVHVLNGVELCRCGQWGWRL